MTESHDESEFSLLALTTLVLRHRWLFIRLALLFAFAGGLYSILRPRSYNSTGSFIGRSADVQSPLAGLASQFGVKVPGTESAFSPAFYAALARAPATLGSLVDIQKPWLPGKDGMTNIAGLLKAKGKSPAAKRNSALEKLQRRVSATSERETGIVSIRVSAPTPQAAALLASSIIDKVSEYHLESRRQNASGERKFVEDRLTEARGELRRAEDMLRRFLEGNRNFSNSPQLSFEHQRLQREVEMRQEVVLTLTQSYEQARIDEVRNLPVISMVDAPPVPVRPAPRGTIVRTLIFFMLGLCLALAIAVLKEVFRRDENRELALASEYEALAAQTGAEVRSPTRMISRLFGAR